MWATALVRHLPREVRVSQSRGLAECTAELAKAPTSLVAIELSRQNLSAALAFLTGLSVKFTLARAIVLIDYELAECTAAECEALAREAGALYFATSPRELAGVGRTVLNHLAGLPATRGSFADHVWDALPWADAATVAPAESKPA